MADSNNSNLVRLRKKLGRIRRRLRKDIEAHRQKQKRKLVKMGLPPVIASITTYPKRVDAVKESIATIAKQTVKPDITLLWLCEEEFVAEGTTKADVERSFSGIPVTLRWVPQGKNMKSFNKYLWIMQENPDAILITFDDDLLYRETLIEELLVQHKAHPNCMISARSHLTRHDGEGRVLSYNKWEIEQKRFFNTPLHSLFVNDGCGALYPPGAFAPSFFDTEVIKRVCEYNDDIWLNLYLWNNHIPKVALPDPKKLWHVEGTQEDCLWTINQTRNNLYLQNAFAEYPDLEEKIIGYIDSESSLS